MKHFASILVILLFAATLLATGCTQRQDGSYAKQDQGAVLGAILGGTLGGIAGSNVGAGSGRTAATIGGAVIGALVGGGIGSSIGSYMDDYDRRMANQTFEKVPTGREVAWHNPDTGRSWELTPTKTYSRPAPEPGYHKDTQYCREYQTEVEINGETQKAYGTACRQPDGSWKIQD